MTIDYPTLKSNAVKYFPSGPKHFYRFKNFPCGIPEFYCFSSLIETELSYK
jgi:hypothetical protein